MVGWTAEARQSATCDSVEACRVEATAAITAEDYERAHDLAWRLVQLSPRRDTDAMALLARAQSLSGRGDDAFVMVSRIADAGVALSEVEESADFARVRAHDRWPELRERLAAMRNRETAKIGESAGPPTTAPTAASASAVAEKSSPAAVSPPAMAGSPAAAASPARPASPALPAAPAFPLARPDLPLPSSVLAPVAFDYDAVSARFVFADGSSGTLKVVSESSGNATNLVSPGWAGTATTTAVAIDRARGDLWVGGTDGERGVLHRLQLISGRRLKTLPFPDDAGGTSVRALAIGPRAVYALDAAGRRVFVVRDGTDAVTMLATLPEDLAPTGLALGGNGLYVAHARGLHRVDLSTGAVKALTVPAGVEIAGLESIAWHRGGLLGVLSTADGRVMVRVRLQARGTSVSRVDVLEATPHPAAALTGDVVFYLASPSEGGVVVRAKQLQ